MAKEKIAHMTNLTFGHNVFNSRLLLLLQNASAGGKGLTPLIVLKRYRHGLSGCLHEPVGKGSSWQLWSVNSLIKIYTFHMLLTKSCNEIMSTCVDSDKTEHTGRVIWKNTTRKWQLVLAHIVLVIWSVTDPLRKNRGSVEFILYYQFHIPPFFP